MSNKKQTIVNSREVYLRLLGLFTAVSLVMFVLTGWVSFPSAEHRALNEKYRQLTNINYDGGSLDDRDKAMNSPEVKSIQNNPKYQYSAAANVAMEVVSAAVSIGLLAYIYAYMRRRQVGDKHVRDASLIGAVGTTVAYLVGLAGAKYVGYPDVSAFDGEMLAGAQAVAISLSVIAVFLISWLVSYLVVRVCQWWMDRKYAVVTR